MPFPFIFNRIFPIHSKATYVKCSGLSPSPFYLFPLLSAGFLQGTLLLFVIFSESVCFPFSFGQIISLIGAGDQILMSSIQYICNIQNWWGLNKKFSILFPVFCPKIQILENQTQSGEEKGSKGGASGHAEHNLVSFPFQRVVML